MAGHKRYQKLTAVLTLLGLVLALIPVAVLALPKAQAEPSDPAHPIIGGPDDPWPLDVPREKESENIKSAGSIALVFEMGSWYGYQTMGGAINGTANKACPKDYPEIPANRKRLNGGAWNANCRNWDQNEAVANVIKQLKGSPLSIGIYHYARKQDQGLYGQNTPDLKATSLADDAGYQKVMDKIWSLDATNGKGGNMNTDYGGNSEWGLGKLYLDMLRYQQQQLKNHAGDPNFKPRPLYSKIIIMSVSDPHWHLSKSIYGRNKDVWQINHYVDGESDEDQLNQDLIGKDLDDPTKNFVEDPTNQDSDDDHAYKWCDLPLNANPGRLGMLDVSRRIRNLGADIRAMGMGDWVDRFDCGKFRKRSTRHAFLRALAGDYDPTNPNPVYPFKPYGGGNDYYQYIPFKSDSGGSPNSDFSYPNGEYWKGKNSKDGIANGTFEDAMRKWMWEGTHLALTSDLVDGDFRYVKPNAGQKIYFTPLDTAVTPQNYLTGTDGRVVVNLTKANMDGGVEVRQPARTDKYTLTKFQGHNARCRGLNRVSGGPEDFFPENLDKDANGNAGFKITAAQNSAYFSIKCSSYSRPMQKMQLIKKAETANEQIRYELGGQPTEYRGGASYDFQWTCTDPKADDHTAIVAQGTASRQVKNLNVVQTLAPVDISDAAMPVGTQCRINETLHLPAGYDLAKANGLFTSETSLEAKNFKIDDTQTQKNKNGGQSVSNQIVGTVQLHDPDNTTTEISQLVDHTIYSSLLAHIKIDVRFSNSKNDPALAKKIANGTLPAKIPVYYNCRFMPDPTKPPELPETNVGSYPGFVGVDWVGVNTDGTTSVTLGQDEDGNDIWPVGTHCLISTTPPNVNIHGPNTEVGTPVNIPGVVTKDSYNSTICAEDASTKPTAPKDCRNNYFWVHSGGEQVIHLTEDLQRLQGKLRVTKALTGEAANQGLNKEFPMHLSCTDEGVSLPVNGVDTYNFNVKRSEPQLVDKVPAGASCTLTEDAAGSTLTNAEVAVPAPIPVTITDTTVAKEVTVTNDLTYKRANLQINQKVTWGTPPPDAQTQTTLMGKDNLITASCQVPGEAAQPDKTVTITGNGTQTLTDLPAGSVCNVQSVPQDLSGINVNYSAPPQQVTIPASGTATVNLTTTYSLPAAGSWYLRPMIHARPEYQALRSLMPDTVNATLTCAGASPLTVPIDLKNGTSTEIPTAAIPSGANCTLTGQLIPSNEETKFEVRYSAADDQYDQAQAGAALTADIVAPETGKSATQDLHLWFKTETTSVNLSSASTMWTSKAKDATAATDRISVPEKWRKAALGIVANDADSTKVPLDVTCSLGSGANQSTVTYPVQVSNGGTASALTVPVGWNCSASTSQTALKIAGTTAQAPSWQGAGGTASADKYSYQWTSADGQSVTLNRDYRMQLASFNLKKKVGGEGVAIISGDKQFQFNWSCTLNGKQIDIPAPRTIGINTDAQATFGNDLASRLQNLQASGSTQMGRFQQGEWHVIDALPAGAVCTVTEDPSVAQVEDTVWDHYWEITAGYRSRNGEPKTDCRAASDKCRPADVGSTVKAQVLLPRDQDAAPNPYFNNDRDNPKDASGNPRNPVVPSTLPENFAGTMVPWNNYTFQKTQVKVSLSNTGNGAALAHGKTFSARLYCAPPPLIGAEGAELPSSAAAIINVELTFKESATNPGTWEDAIGNQLIPVNYRCVLAEAKFPDFDAKVTTTIAKDPTEPTVTAGKDGLTDLFAYTGEDHQQHSQATDDPNLNNQSGDQQILGFIVHPNLVNNAQDSQKQSIFTIKNEFVRPAAKLNVKQVVRKDDAELYMSFGQVLVDKGEVGYKAHYECTDQYLKDSNGQPLKYQGSMDLAADGEITLLSGDSGGNFVPATSKCDFWHENQTGKDPINQYKPHLFLNPSATVATEGSPDQEEQAGNQAKPDSLRVTPLSLDETGEKVTTITFEDFYFVPYVSYEIGTAVEGARRDEVLPATTQYQYTYSCTYPDGLPVPSTYVDGKYPKVTGTTDKEVRGSFVTLPKLPVDSICKVTGNKPDTSAAPYLKVGANWVPWDVDKLGPFLEDSTNFNQEGLAKTSLSTSPFEITLDKTTQRGAVLYSVYSNGTKVRIYKAKSPQGEVVPDATFSLYERKADESAGTQIELVPVKGQPGVYEPKTELAPGNYLLGNTNAGKNAGERFPFGWKFGIVLDPADQKAEQDTVVKLDPEAFSSGLIATYKPDENVKAWQIELADVNVGNLPLTGGYLPWLWLVGISLVAASAAVMWQRRRE